MAARISAALLAAIFVLSPYAVAQSDWPVQRYNNGTVAITSDASLHLFAAEGSNARIFGDDIVTHAGSINDLFDRVSKLERGASDDAPLTLTADAPKMGNELRKQTKQCTYESIEYLPANSTTAQWGTFNASRPSVASVKHGDTFTVDVITHHSGHDYAKMIKGDPDVEDVYYWSSGDDVNAKSQGLSRPEGAGVHVITGPVNICGVEPDDIVEVRINKLRPRQHPVHGRTFGTNSNKFAGFPFRVGHQPGAATPNGQQQFNESGGHEQITVYEFITNDDGEFMYGKPVYQFMVPTTEGPDGKKRTVDSEPALVMPHEVNYGYDDELMDLPNIDDASNITYEEGFDGTALLDSGNGSSSIVYNPFGYDGDWKVPLRPHLGILGLTPANIINYDNEADDVTSAGNSIPPARFGGNIDDHRIGEGGIMFYKAELEGGQLFFGDTHGAQGDSELAGTAMETSLTAEVTVYVHKVDDGLPAKVQDLDFPLLETSDYWVVHGFAYNNYLDQLSDPSEIFAEGDSIDLAFEDTYNKTVNWLRRTHDLSEAEAITMMSLSVDFGVTQVVDGNWGVHASIPKFNFDTTGAAYDYTGDVPEGGRPGVGSNRGLLETDSGTKDLDRELSGTFERMTKRPSARRSGSQESAVEHRMKNGIYKTKSQLHRALRVRMGYDTPGAGTVQEHMVHDAEELERLQPKAE